MNEITLVREDEVIVDLVGNDGEAVAVGNLDNGGEVLGGEDGTTGVGGVVHHDGHCVLVNLNWHNNLFFLVIFLRAF